MKAMLKKTICIISSAIMLCGASAIPANAKDPTFRPELNLPELIVDVGRKPLCLGYYLNSYNFEITPSETAIIEAKTDRKLSFDRVAEYQWYKDGKAIKGATLSAYPATEAGKYYCEITERDREFQTMEIATTTTTTKSIGLRPVGTRTTTAAMQKQTIDIGQRLTPVTTTAESMKISSVKKFTTGEATVKTVPELTIKSQSYGQDLKYNTQLYVNPTGGSGTYYYTWTDANGNWVGNTQKLSVASVGTYKCEVRDSKGRKVASGPIYVEYSEMILNYGIINGWVYNFDFEQSDKNDATIDVTVEVKYGGTGKYKYNWQRLVGNKWVDMDWHSATLTVRKDEVKDNESRYYDEYIGGNRYWMQHMLYNDYRCQVSSLNCKGEVVGTTNTATIQINSLLERYIR